MSLTNLWVTYSSLERVSHVHVLYALEVLVHHALIFAKIKQHRKPSRSSVIIGNPQVFLLWNERYFSQFLLCRVEVKNRFHIQISLAQAKRAAMAAIKVPTAMAA